MPNANYKSAPDIEALKCHLVSQKSKWHDGAPSGPNLLSGEFFRPAVRGKRKSIFGYLFGKHACGSLETAHFLCIFMGLYLKKHLKMFSKNLSKDGGMLLRWSIHCCN